MKNLSTDNLDSFVAFVDRECNQNLNDKKISEKFFPLNLLYKTLIDESLDPFSDEYFQSQVNLYEEIAGKQLDQWSGELHPINVDALLNCSNPLGINNVDMISGHVRAISSMLSLSCLEPDAPVLDLGAGHGLSSEIYAFCGCHVHAIDIDPALSELATRRANARSLRITRSVMNFDSLSTVENNHYQAAFFFQSFHHSLRPWDLIAELKSKLSNNGVIAFCGEPIQNYWWKHWGLRLDHESLYVARKFGWFESGWSRDFITECFKKNGLTLVLLDTGLKGGLCGVTSKNTDKLSRIINNAISLGITKKSATDSENSVQNYRSQIGRLTKNELRPSIITNSNHGGGFLCYGPYISLPQGYYRVSFILHFIDNSYQGSEHYSSVFFDIVSNAGQLLHYNETIVLNGNDKLRLVNVEFELKHHTVQLEARIRVPQGSEMWEMSYPVFERITISTSGDI